MLAPQFQCSHPFAVIAVAKSPSDTQGSFKACAAVFSRGQLCQQLLNVGVGVLQLVMVYTIYVGTVEFATAAGSGRSLQNCS